MKLIMRHNNVLIKPRPLQPLSKTIVLPDDTQLRPDPVGTVLAVGPEVRDVSVGDTVYFGTYAGTWFTYDGDEVIVLHEQNILAKEE